MVFEELIQLTLLLEGGENVRRKNWGLFSRILESMPPLDFTLTRDGADYLVASDGDIFRLSEDLNNGIVTEPTGICGSKVQEASETVF